MQWPPQEPQRANPQIQVPSCSYTWRPKQGGDAVSRYPTEEKEPPLLHLPNEVACTWNPQTARHNFMAGIRTPQVDQKDSRTMTRPGIVAISPLATLNCVTWDCVWEAITSDEDMHLLLTIIEDGVPQPRHELPRPLQPYYQYRERQHSTDGVILYKGCVVIPPCLRQEVPVRAPLCPPGHNFNDHAGRIFRLLARDHLSY